MLLAIFFILQCVNMVYGHVYMQDPPARRSKYSEYYVSQGLVDYNLMAPLNVEPYTFPCKGYKKGPSTSTINGNKLTIKLEGTAVHGGGHCQFGITFDDNTFVVLKTVIGDCLTSSMSYDMDLPSGLSGDVTVFWTWINRIGNREYYMDCADITVNNGGSGSIEVSGKELLVVNLPGYPTIPEGLPAGNDGVDLLNARKDITVTSGSTSNGDPQPSSPSPSSSLSSSPQETQTQTQTQIETQTPKQNVPSQFTSSVATFYFRVGPDQVGCPAVQTFNDGRAYGPCNVKYGESSKYWAAIKNGGQHCGDEITVNYNGKSLVLTVMDECPACGSDNHVDMSLDALIELTGSVNAACAINTLQPQITWGFGGSLQRPQPSSTTKPRIKPTINFSQPPSSIERTSTKINNTRRRKTRIRMEPIRTTIQPVQPTPNYQSNDYEEFKDFLEFKKMEEQYQKDCEDN